MQELPAGAVGGLQHLLLEIEQARKGRLYFLCLLATLSAIDICAAVGSENGRSSGAKFRAWVTAQGLEDAQGAAGLWHYRCSLLHQAQNIPRQDGQPIAFLAIDPEETGSLHQLSLDVGGERIGVMTVDIFVRDAVRAINTWLESEACRSRRTLRNLEAQVHYRQDGLGGFITGAPTIY